MNPYIPEKGYPMLVNQKANDRCKDRIKNTQYIIHGKEMTVDNVRRIKQNLLEAKALLYLC